MRYKLKRDVHHAAISAALKLAGFFVLDLSMVGCGCPDLAISRNGIWCLVEIKTQTGPNSLKTASGRLRANQIEFHTDAKGPIITAYTASEVVFEFNRLLKLRNGWVK